MEEIHAWKTFYSKHTNECADLIDGVEGTATRQAGCLSCQHAGLLQLGLDPPTERASSIQGDICPHQVANAKQYEEGIKAWAQIYKNPSVIMQNGRHS